jgi:2,4-dienoyl-CoA reductase-like NADH-dependent reductase (Old Yellow Enzyme family)
MSRRRDRPHRENRCRLTLEVAKITRDLWPKDKPVFCRVSGTDWHPDGEKDAKGEYISWGLEQTIWLARKLKDLGVDYYDITSGGNYDKQVVTSAPGYNAFLAEAVKKAVPGLLIGSVGLIQSPELGASPGRLPFRDGTHRVRTAEEILQTGKADAISLGRELLRNADFILGAAQKFGAPIQLCNQHYRVRSTVRFHPVPSSPVGTGRHLEGQRHPRSRSAAEPGGQALKSG